MWENQITMPSEEASDKEWYKVVFMQNQLMMANLKNMRQSIDFTNNQVTSLKNKVSTSRDELSKVNKDIDCLKKELYATPNQF